MTVTKKLIGRLPILLGEYDSTKTYSNRQRVTLYGSEFESKIDNNTAAPATLSNGTLTINTDNWRVVSNGTEAFLAGEKIKQFAIEENSEFANVSTDADGKLLESTDINGKKTIYGDLEIKGNVKSKLESSLNNKVDKVDGKSLIDKNFSDNKTVESDPENRLELKTDNSGKILSYRDVKGGLHEDSLGVRELTFDNLKNGYKVGDLSELSYIRIDIPKCAVINISGIYSMPTTKTDDKHGYVEFLDMQGNYFKKKAILNAQGNSSMGFPKKNIAIDFCDDDWIGDKTPSIQFGNWVAQDSFHVKAYCNDFFRGVGVVTYQLYEEILKTRGIFADRPWKKDCIDFNRINEYPKYIADELYGKLDLQFDNGALCHPDGFPAIVYFNNEFYGVFSFQLKKAKENYYLKKSEATNIHLDPNNSINGIFKDSASIPWDDMEIRVPKSLICMDGSKYDGDHPKELIDSTSEKYDASNKKHKMSAEVKKYIQNISESVSKITNAATTYESSSKTAEDLKTFQDVFNTYFDSDELIDYIICINIVGCGDSDAKNWQWFTYNGKKWHVGMYDTDAAFGNQFNAREIRSYGEGLYWGLFGNRDVADYVPTKFIFKYFKTELQARYKYLADIGIVTVKHIFGKLMEWVNRIGYGFYELEHKKWGGAATGKASINTEYWKPEYNEDGSAKTASTETFNATKAYSVDEEVSFGRNDYTGYYVFKCIKATIALESNTPHTPSTYSPITWYSYSDSIYRAYNWLNSLLKGVDKEMNYTRNN